MVKTQGEGRYLIYLTLFCCLLLAIIAPANGATTVNSTIYTINKTENSLTWDIHYLTNNRPLGALLDGQEIIGFNTNFNTTYTATELEANSSHTMCVYGEITINCDTSFTLEHTLTGEEKTWDFIWYYKYLVLGIIVIIVCLAFSSPIFGFLGLFIFFVGFIDAMFNNSLNIGTRYDMIVYGLGMVVGAVIAYAKSKGG